MSERSVTRSSGLTIGVGVAAALLVVMPVVGTEFFVNFVLTRSLILGLAASSIVFLSSYVGMVSLAQFLLVGVAGFTIGNCVADSGKGLKLGLDPWLAVLLALVIATTVAMLLGALASRTTGIYFLMLTLTYAVIGYYVFGQVTSISGFGGITGVNPPGFFDTHPVRVYYAVLALSVLAYAGIRALRRSPFGLSLEGIRDDPVRMSALGFNVPVHRTLAFTLAGFVAGSAGVINIWWNGQIDPNSVNIGATLDLFIIAVIGGISHLEGAWLGAFVFIVIQNYVRDFSVTGLGFGGTLFGGSFNTIVGIIFLVIVLVSPAGLMGAWDRGLAEIARRRGLMRTADEPAAGAGI